MCVRASLGVYFPFGKTCLNGCQSEKRMRQSSLTAQQQGISQRMCACTCVCVKTQQGVGDYHSLRIYKGKWSLSFSSLYHSQQSELQRQKMYSFILC